jgi:rRNA processing protein Gar1
MAQPITRATVRIGIAAALAGAGFVVGTTLLGASTSDPQPVLDSASAGATSPTLPKSNRTVRCTPDGPEIIVTNEDPRPQVPVAGRNGEIVGYVDRDLLGPCRQTYLAAPPDGIEALPVRDSRGNVVGYLFANLGFLDAETARDPARVEQERASVQAIICQAQPTARGC